MSRFQEQNQKYEIAYGQDHICGLFIQVFDRASLFVDKENVLVDLDEVFDGLTPEKMAEIAEEYGFHIELPEGTIN